MILFALLIMLNLPRYEKPLAVSSNPSTVTSTDNMWTNSLKFKVHFNGNLQIEYKEENTTRDEDRPTIDASINFTKKGNYVLTEEKIALPFLSFFPFNLTVDTTTIKGIFNFKMSGEGKYEDRVATGNLTIYPILTLLGFIEIGLDPIPMRYNVTENRLYINGSATIPYVNNIINYTTAEALRNQIENMGLNQSYLNSTIYTLSNGILECVFPPIGCINETDFAFLNSSMTVEGNILRALPYIFANIAGLPSPEESVAMAIESAIDAALDLVMNSSYTISTIGNLLTYSGTTFFVSTLDTDLSELKNDILDDFPPDIEEEELDFLYETDLRISGVSITYSSGPDEATYDLKGLFLQPPVEWANATNFTIPGLFDVCGLIFPEDLSTLIIEGVRNATHEVRAIIPPGVPEPSSQSLVTWINVNPDHLSGVTFKIVSLAAPFIFTLQDLFKFAALAGIIMATVIMVQQSRKGIGPAAGPSLKQEEEDTSSSAPQ